MFDGSRGVPVLGASARQSRAQCCAREYFQNSFFRSRQAGRAWRDMTQLWPVSAPAFAWPPGSALTWAQPQPVAPKASVIATSRRIAEAATADATPPAAAPSPAVEAAVAAALAAHAPTYLGVQEYCSAHGIGQGVAAALNAVSNTVPVTPWRVLADALPQDVSLNVATVPGTTNEEISALARRWQMSIAN